MQNIRKDSGFELTDRISVTINENGKIQPSLIEFKEYICREILASSLEFVPNLTSGTTIEVNEATLIVNVKKKLEAWQHMWERWNQANYCHRCGAVYVDGNSQYAPPEHMLSLLSK